MPASPSSIPRVMPPHTKSIKLDGTFMGTKNLRKVGSLSPRPTEAHELDASYREVIQILKDFKWNHPDKYLE